MLVRAHLDVASAAGAVRLVAALVAAAALCAPYRAAAAGPLGRGGRPGQSAKARPAAPRAPQPLVVLSAGLHAPQATVHDPDSDTYLVSNAPGVPLERGNSGFVSELAPDGGVVAPRLVQGGRDGATLHWPVGLAVANGTLYVADLDTIRLFDRVSGAPAGELLIEGARAIRALSLGPNGLIYAVDSGRVFERDPAHFRGVGSDRLFVITPGPKPTAKTVLRSTRLDEPGGVVALPNRLLVVSLAGAQLQSYDFGGRWVRPHPVVLPTGGLAAIAHCGRALFISSLDVGVIYRGQADGPFAPFIGGVGHAWGLACDAKRRRLLVSVPARDRVEVYRAR